MRKKRSKRKIQGLIMEISFWEKMLAGLVCMQAAILVIVMGII